MFANRRALDLVDPQNVAVLSNAHGDAEAILSDDAVARPVRDGPVLDALRYVSDHRWTDAHRRATGGA